MTHTSRKTNKKCNSNKINNWACIQLQLMCRNSISSQLPLNYVTSGLTASSKSCKNSHKLRHQRSSIRVIKTPLIWKLWILFLKIVITSMKMRKLLVIMCRSISKSIRGSNIWRIVFNRQKLKRRQLNLKLTSSLKSVQCCSIKKFN